MSLGAGVPAGTDGADFGCASSPVTGCTPVVPRFGQEVPTDGRANRAIPGLSIDAGMMITSRIDVGLGIDVSTYGRNVHPSTTPDYFPTMPELLETRASDERWLQIDLAGRFNYMGKEQSLARRSASHRISVLAAVCLVSLSCPWPAAVESSSPLHVRVFPARISSSTGGPRICSSVLAHSSSWAGRPCLTLKRATYGWPQTWLMRAVFE